MPNQPCCCDMAQSPLWCKPSRPWSVCGSLIALWLLHRHGTCVCM
jgi:hypothetical protein